MSSGVVRLRNIPYGFFEKELYGYFNQFGKICRVRVIRSRRGYPTGIAFVEFKDKAVAEIAAETMNGYILAEKRLQCKTLSGEELPKCITKGDLFSHFDKPQAAKIRHAKQQKTTETPQEAKQHALKFLKSLKKREKKLKELGIDYTYDFDKKWKFFEAAHC